MKIAQVLAEKHRSFSFEFFPPKDAVDALALGATLGELRQLKPTFVSVTYGAGGSGGRSTFEVCRYIQDRLQIPAMAHFTCVGATETELRASLEYIKSVGIENVMLLRGDPPRGQSTPTLVEGGLRYASDIVRLAKGMGGFGIGAAAYPEKHREVVSFEADLDHLYEKVKAGVDFLITQLFFENDKYFQFVSKARSRGILIPILPGIMPITQFKQIKRMAELSGASIPESLQRPLEAAAEDQAVSSRLGIEFAVRQCRDLLVGGAPGIHFYTLNKSHATTEIFRALVG